MADVRVSVIGATRVHVDGRPVDLSPRQRVVVATLVLRRRGVSPETLRVLSKITTKDSLQTTIADLRRRLRDAGAGDVVRFASAGYELANVAVDIDEIADALAIADEKRRSGSLDEAATRYRQSFDALSAGPPYVEVDDVDAVAEHVAWEELRLRAAEGWFEIRVRQGGHLSVLDELRRTCAAHPTHEGIVGWCAVALALSHRQSEALRLLSDLRAMLVNEHGQSLGDFATRVELAILRQDLTALGCARPTHVRSIPRRLRDLLDVTFVGRVAELEALRAALDERRARLIVVSGGPGVGKSMLAARWAEMAANAARQVSYTWCEEEDVSGNLTAMRWLADLEILDAVAAGGLPASNSVQLGEHLRQHCRLVGPAVAVIDDAHWIDPGSASVLRTLLSASDADLHVLATVRTERQRPPWLTLHTDLALRDIATDIHLTEFELSDVVALAERMCASKPAGPRRRLARHVHHRSGGNALIAARLLVSNGPEIHGENALQLALSRELDSVPIATHAALRTAAVIGIEFELDVLAAVLDHPSHEVIDLLEPAWKASILDESSAGTTYRFHHDLFRSTLLDEISSTRRREIHHRLATLLTADDRHSRARRAVHLCEASPSVPAVQARQAALAAGEESLAAGDYPAAIALLERTLKLTDAADRTADPAVVPLASALEHLGETERSEELLAGAFAHALAARDHRRITQIALAGRGRGLTVGTSDHRRARLARALETAADADRRLDLIAELALVDAAAGNHLAARRRAREARRLARRVPSAGARGRAALALRASLEGTSDLRLRNAASRSAVRHSTTAGDTEARVVATAFLTSDLLQAGRLAEAVESAALEDELADVAPTPKERWFAIARRVCFAQLAGHFDIVDAATTEALELGNELGFVEAFNGWTVHLFTTALMRTGVADLAPAIAMVVETSPGTPAWRAGLSLALAQADDADAHDALTAAVEHLARLPASPYASAGWLVAAQAAAELGRRDVAASIDRHLAPYGGQLLVVGTTVASLGPVDRALGLLALVTGNRTTAEQLFRRAAELARRVASPPWELWSQAAAAVCTAGTRALCEFDPTTTGDAMPALTDHLNRVLENL